MTTLTQTERLAVLETKVDTVLEAVEKTSIKIDGLGGSLNAYAKKTELYNAVAERNKIVASLEKRVEDMAKAHTWTVWLTGTFSAAAGITLTLLIEKAFGG